MTQPFKAQSDTRLVTDAKQDASFNKSAKIASKKFADIKLRGGIKPIRQMDSSDLRKPDNSQAIKKLMELKQQETKALALASNSSLPPHLLMASLLEQLCYMYVKERTKANQLFKILCERLSRLNVIAPLSHLDEMSSLRFQHRAMLDKIVRTAMKSLDRQSLLALPPVDQTLNIDSLSIKDDDVISEHTSRYNIEFQEVSLLGKGGFGYVFKARNYLDGCEYAVKKIKFKHKNTDKLLKLLREVKALANLHHTNIVGYNAAWLEYDNPYGSRKENVSHQCALEEDSSKGGSESKRLDRQDQSASLSVEFCSSDDENHSPLYPHLAGNGLAMNAKYFSQVKVTEVFGRKENVLHNREIGDVLHNGGIEDATEKVVSSSSLTPGSPMQQADRCPQQTDRCPQQTDRCPQQTDRCQQQTDRCPQQTDRWQQPIDRCPQLTDRCPQQTDRCPQQTDRCQQLTDRCQQPTDRCQHVVIEEEISSSINFNYSDNNCESQTQEKLMLKYGKHFQIDLEISPDHKLDNLAMNTQALGRHKNPESVHLHGHSSVSPVSKLKRVPISATTNSSIKETDNDSIRGSRTCSPLRAPQETVHVSRSRTCSPLREPQETVHQKPTESPSTKSSSSTKSSPAQSSPSRSPFRHSKFFHNRHISDDEDVDPFPDDACQDDKLSCPESQGPPSTSPSPSYIYSKVSLLVEEELSYAGLPPPRRMTRPSRSMEHPAPRVSHVSEKDGAYFVAMDTTASPSRRGSQKDELPSYKRSISSGAANNTDEIMESRNHNYDFQNSITLYIQMELCSKTLQDWLNERNLEPEDSIDTTSFRLDNMRIFHQLLLGVNFIHSHGLIHRDLKPRNIFLSGNDLHVKIGDFGLAKENMLSQGREEIVLKPSPTDEVSAFPYDNHTTGVGTSSYASPEQLQGSFYDVKSDMYSLGVILFEIFNVFHTEMERLKEIEKLRKKNHCPKAFKQKWPLQANSIQALVSSVPSERPSAKDLLNSQLFLSQEQQIKWLQQKVLHQEKEIEELKNTNQEKDRLIAKLQKSLKEAQSL